MSEVKNHYEKIPKKFKEEERHYDNEKTIRIKLPFRMCIIGASGSGKTNCLIEIIEQMNAWDKIIIMAKNTEEPLYATLIDTIQEAEKKSESSILTVGNKIEELPDLKTLDKKNNTLVIVDDMINEKDKLLGRVADYYTMGRKQNVSTIFLSQSYFKIPKIIRENTGYFIFTKISGDRDLLMILKDFELGVTEEQLIKLYRQAASGFPNFFLIDRETNDKDLVFRKNFSPMKPPESTETKAASNIVAPPLKGSFKGKKFNAKDPGGTEGKIFYKGKWYDKDPRTRVQKSTDEFDISKNHNFDVSGGKQNQSKGKKGHLINEHLDDHIHHHDTAMREDDPHYHGMNDVEDPIDEEEGDWQDWMEDGSGIMPKRKRKRAGKIPGVTSAKLRRTLKAFGL